MTMTCEYCHQEVDSVNEADMCEDCHDRWFAEQYAYWYSLYLGEKAAGLLDPPEEI